MKVVLTGTKAGEFTALLKRDQQKIARAATAAIKDAADQVRTGGRAAISAGGFSKRWQNAFRVNMYPATGTSLDPAMWAFSKIDYADIFQTGGTIRGRRGLLWVPLPSVPARYHGQRMTVRLYLQNIGPLQVVKKAGHPPVLMGRVLRKVAVGKKVTPSRLRRGAAAHSASKRTNFVPLFVGLSSVHIRQKFNVRGVYTAASAQVPENFFRHMEELS